MRRLLIRPGAIGDCIASLPALEMLKTAYTEVWISRPVAPLLGFADRVESISSTGLDLLELPDIEPPAGLLPRLRSFDSVVSWYGAGRVEFRDCVARLGLPFVFFSALPSESMGIHAVDFYLSQVQPLADDQRAIVRVPRIPCQRRDDGFAVIHPFASAHAKEWPLERFRQLATALGPAMPVCWCAGPEEDLAGAVRYAELSDLARWLACARVYIGNDSGIGHLAAAVGTPVVALFGPTDPAVWAPRGDRVAVLRGGPLMGDLSVDQVVDSVWHLIR